jgi:2-(1,2-epoxy-1,2-dihydrophenyl)acetyl-CoA isomerase
MQETSIRIGRLGAVFLVTLNRPDVLNSFTMPMARALQEALDEADRDESVRALLLTGAGRAFCAGQDLEEALPRDGRQAPPIRDIVARSYNPIIRRLRKIEKPVVCAVNGVAAGAGANIALACDFVIAAEEASFVQAFVRIGLVPDSGGTFFLPRLAGLARAAAMTMLGEKVSARQANDWGMIHAVCSGDRLMDEALALANRLAALPTKAIGLTKRAFNASLAQDLEAQLELEERLQGKAGETEDYREGVAAFHEKRPPRFTGK